MHLADILSPTQIIPDMRANDRWEAIDELVGQLAIAGRIAAEHVQDIAASVKKREQTCSTAIGFGVGIPHAVSDLVSEVVGALGRGPKGIDFKAVDNQPVTILILFLVPQGQMQKHLQTLSQIARNLHKPDFRNSLAQAPDAEAIYRVIASINPGK